MFAIVIYPDLLLRLQQRKQALPSANFRSRLMSCCHLPLPVLMNTVKPHFTDTHSIRTLHFYRQFALSLGKESPYIFSKVNPLNTDTSLLRTVCFVPGEESPYTFSKVNSLNADNRQAYFLPNQLIFIVSQPR